MGTRYVLTIVCPECGQMGDNVWYAPTCDFVGYTCGCGCVTDLEEYTGITYTSASNADLIKAIIGEYK